MIEFSLAPTVEVFNRCRKKDLLLIAEFFKISVSRDVTKAVLKDELYTELVNSGILPVESKTDGLEEQELVEIAETNVDAVPIGNEPIMDPLLEIKLKELELAIKQQEHETELVHLRVIEVQADRDIKLKTLSLEAEALRYKPVSAPSSRPSSPLTALPAQSSTVNFGSPNDARVNFDVAKYIKLVPPFREAEVDAYFTAFERIAEKLGWPKDMWGLLLQCNFVGKAQEVCAALPIEQSLDYDVVKAAVLRAYELVPEAYRQRFRGTTKTAKHTFVEFAREKRTLFEKWCLVSLSINCRNSSCLKSLKVVFLRTL